MNSNRKYLIGLCVATLSLGALAQNADEHKDHHPAGTKPVALQAKQVIIATGSNPFILPIPGKDLQGVLAYRDIADTQAMIDAAATYKHAVVIGGGLLGLEAANGLMLRGMDVTVVHIAPWLMDRQLDEVAAKWGEITDLSAAKAASFTLG